MGVFPISYKGKTLPLMSLLNFILIYLSVENRYIMKKALKILAVIVVLLGIVVAFNYSRLNIISGYSAKSMSSSVFVAGRSVEFTDTHDNDFGPINIADDVVDEKERSASASVFGLMTRKAVYRKGLGSVLVTDDYDFSQETPVPHRSNITRMTSYPYGGMKQKDTVFSNVNYEQINTAVDNAFYKS